jgi:hypothetical protein
MDSAARRHARQQVQNIRAFYVHLSVYIAVVTMLVLINVASGDAWRGNWWVQWPAMAWGAAVVIHGIFALRGYAYFGPEWEERKIEEIMRRQKQN